METTVRARVYRLIVLALVAFFFLYNFHPDAWTNQVGWSWRFLTNWGQALSLVVAALMVGRSFGLTRRWPDTLVSVTVVVNLMVVVLYWQLYFDDPALVNVDGEPPVWWREYYLHLMGPILQWIDAFLIFGCFRRPIRVFGGMAGFIVLYSLWLELILRPFSSTPIGTVTNGLPYPFLNDMILSDRIWFYGENLIQGWAAVLLCGLIALALRRFAGLGRE